MPHPDRYVQWLFRLAAIFAAMFILTILMLSAATFSEVRSPSAALVERHADMLLAIGAGGSLLFGIAAMTIDRMLYLRSNGRKSQTESEEATVPDAPE